MTVGAGGDFLDIFTLVHPFSPLFPSPWEAARYRLKNCLKGPLKKKTNNQPKSFWKDTHLAINMLKALKSLNIKK